MNRFRTAAILVAGAVLAGCAHPIVISPDISRIQPDGSSMRINKNVGYYIDETKRSDEVTTPGGGGDEVKYTPYKDTETAFYKILTNVFANVTQLKTDGDVTAIQQNHLNYIIVPEIVTNSSSSSGLTWPPTDFNYTLTCKVVDVFGKPVGTYTAEGIGKAEFSQFKSDFALAGKLAAQDGLLKMQKTLSTAPELRK